MDSLEAQLINIMHKKLTTPGKKNYKIGQNSPPPLFSDFHIFTHFHISCVTEEHILRFCAYFINDIKGYTIRAQIGIKLTL